MPASIIAAVKVLHTGFAWAGAALFVAAIAYFLFAYCVTFGEITSGDFDTRAVAANITLFTVFAVHHSVFARNRVRQAVHHVVGPALERSVYVWIASLMLIAVCAYWRPLPGVVWQIGWPWRWLSLAAQAAGLWLTARSAAIIDFLELAGLRQAATPTSEHPMPHTKAAARRATEPNRDLGGGSGAFKTAGPYGLVRHPIYAGWILIVFGVGTMTLTRLVFAVVSTVYLLIAIPLEERSLRRTSLGDYDEYAKAVRWKLIPHIY